MTKRIIYNPNQDGDLVLQINKDGTPTEAMRVKSNDATVSFAKGTVENVNTVSSANYTVLSDDGYQNILATTGASNRTITLPAVAESVGRRLTIQKVDSASGYVIIDGNGAETIDGDATLTLYGQNESVTLLSDGTEWKITNARWFDGTFTPVIATVRSTVSDIQVAQVHRIGKNRIRVSGAHTTAFTGVGGQTAVSAITNIPFRASNWQSASAEVFGVAQLYRTNNLTIMHTSINARTVSRIIAIDWIPASDNSTEFTVRYIFDYKPI